MKENIVLVGFMGTGKSATGRRLANHLCMQFVDMDKEIEKEQGKTISQIFKDEGEEWFREREHEKVKELSAQSGLIISTGGGVVLNPENIRAFEETGTVVCLKAGVDVILRRLATDKRRPLLKGKNKRERITALLEERKPFYDAIPIQIDTSYMSHEEVAAADYNACHADG
jgi:shikimate kinase